MLDIGMINVLVACVVQILEALKFFDQSEMILLCGSNNLS